MGLARFEKGRNAVTERLVRFSGLAGKAVALVLESRRRAKFWARCDDAFAEHIGFGKHRTGRRSLRAEASHGAGDGEGERTAVEAVAQEEDLFLSEKLTRRRLSPHLGRSSLTFFRQDLQLIIDWNISFDWTGEAQSRVSAATAVPGACEYHPCPQPTHSPNVARLDLLTCMMPTGSRVDSRGTMSKVPEMFHKLVKEKGMFQATQTIVRLLFAE